MGDWLKIIAGAISGFVAGRIGSAVDTELSRQHATRTTIPALLAAQEATNRALDMITEKLAAMSRGELSLRAEIRQFRDESARARDNVNDSLQEQSRRLEHLAQRVDMLSDSTTGVPSTPYDPRLTAPSSPRGSHQSCRTGLWVPPLDREGWGQQTEESPREP